MNELEKPLEAHEGDEFTGSAIIAKGWVVFRCPVCEKPIKMSEGEKQASVACPACEAVFDLELPGGDATGPAGDANTSGLGRANGEVRGASQAAGDRAEAIRVVLPGERDGTGPGKTDRAGGTPLTRERHSKLLRLNPERTPEFIPLEEAKFDDAWLARHGGLGWGVRRNAVWIVAGAVLLAAVILGTVLWSINQRPPAGEGAPASPLDNEGSREVEIVEILAES